jgi:hypothetical protein
MAADVPCSFPVISLHPAVDGSRCSADAGLRRYPQNYLFIPWLDTEITDFGQNSMISRSNKKIPLLFSLFIEQETFYLAPGDGGSRAIGTTPIRAAMSPW